MMFAGIAGAELLIEEDQPRGELDHHGSGGRPQQQHPAGSEEVRKPAAG